jgi:hypothetical protein
MNAAAQLESGCCAELSEEEGGESLALVADEPTVGRAPRPPGLWCVALLT